MNWLLLYAQHTIFKKERKKKIHFPANFRVGQTAMKVYFLSYVNNINCPNKNILLKLHYIFTYYPW
jgi:hypothetical protein